MRVLLDNQKNRHSRHDEKAFSLTYRIIFIIGLILFLLLGKRISPVNVHADYPDMDMNATPNPVGSGARAMGMGGSFISIADDATAASWNPGGLPQLLKQEISIVGSLFSGRINYKTAEIEEGDIEDASPGTRHLNYLSFVRPFMLFRRNLVFSLNYQLLYEFSKDNIYTWKEKMADFSLRAYKRQRGSLNTISPSLAFQITPPLFLGLTANFWPHSNLDNGWENLNIIDQEASGEKIITHTEIYERYQFSGFNMNIGILYHFFFGQKKQLRLGGLSKPLLRQMYSMRKEECHIKDILKVRPKTAIQNHSPVKTLP